ncbi:MAG: metallophosphoesterase [Deltaproteobacteria bacterium]|nr:metallophosphoesterase [Deltaproteobacteria bacterium]
MGRYAALLALIVLPVLASMSCARSPGPEIERPATRPVPDAKELTNWLGSDAKRDPDVPDFFIQMADPQLGMSGSPLWLALFGATWNDDNFQLDARLFETAIAHANELAPAFVVICGDLVNKAGHAGQIAEFRRIAATLDRSIPLYFVAGNHDVENNPTAESLHAYRETFGSDWYSFRNGEVYGIVLNSQLIDAAKHVPQESENQLRWLRKELVHASESGARHVLVFQHHPYFLVSPDEGDQYFNIDREMRAVYLELFKQAGVEAILAGHYHRNAHGRDGELEMITSGPVGRPLGDDPSGLRIVKAGRDSLRHEYFALESR